MLDLWDGGNIVANQTLEGEEGNGREMEESVDGYGGFEEM